MEIKLMISGMHCTSCEKMIAMAVGDVEGAKVVAISHKTGEATISCKDEKTLSSAKKAIETEGYKIIG